MGKSFKLGNKAVCSYCRTSQKDIGLHLLDFHYKCKTCGRWDKSKEFHKCWKKLTPTVSGLNQPRPNCRMDRDHTTEGCQECSRIER